MASLGMDEYLKPCQNSFEPIYEIVSRLVEKAGNEAAGIGVNWAIFGSSHREKKPDGLITENFIYRAEKDFGGCFHVKTICNPRLVKNFISPHYPLYIIGGQNDNVRTVIKTFKKNSSTILNYFSRLASNAPAEAFNPKVKIFCSQIRGGQRPRCPYFATCQITRLVL